MENSSERLECPLCKKLIYGSRYWVDKTWICMPCYLEEEDDENKYQTSISK